MVNQVSPLRIMIVEDEFITLDALRDALQDMGYLIAGDAMNVKEAKAVLADGNVDLAILDINLRGATKGIELAHFINEHYGIPFIFLTAYDDPTTIQLAADTKPYGYLIKPFNSAAIHAALKIAATHTLQNDSNEPVDHLLLRDAQTLFRVRIGEIKYVESFRNYIEINLDSGKKLIRGTLTNFEEQLPPRQFVRPHRSYLVNASRITSFHKSSIEVGEHLIPVSRAGYKSVTEYFATVSNQQAGTA